ncbi:MAG: hypothetical protein COV72_07375 [Candidatus Omnitrophica bacterium CG11_big_fil_rev_8_21_14_0_20_42_13]|uniref:histidine kinase n=1 Tax=Candidatus Ghiorseimicrobium undicola TaxID=1974746 RepID=A0A2H0LY75_9BACT|nr:MAG: hypothetical protein COV72_07375 [Candidatus Omnitrophica bacterium CG11_big_fil_rev_8_21_14_0_20_42_13]
METIYFFYGLAFLLLGIIIFAMPARSDFFGLSRHLRLVGLFGITHGLNEWIDLFIYRGRPFDVEFLKAAGNFILPLSYLFLAFFGARVISAGNKKMRWLNLIWICGLMICAWVYFSGRGFPVTQISARYFLCIPGIVLTVLALRISALRTGKSQSAGLSRFGLSVASYVFIIYAFLSGLVVPKADFLLAPVINYQSFSALFGFPVQALRMLCALLLAVAFFLATGLFYYEGDKIKLKGGIRRKIISLLYIITAIMMAISFIFGYSWESRFLRRTIGAHHQKIAAVTAGHFSSMIDEKAKVISAYNSDMLWRNAAKEANLRYESLSREEIKAMLLDNDSRWIGEKNGDGTDLIRQITDSQVSREMQSIVNEDETISEIILTDKYGGLVAASGEASDFYQADEPWWQEVFNDPAGGLVINDIRFDESANSWVMPFSIALKDTDGEFSGVSKASVNLTNFMRHFASFDMTKDQEMALIDSEGDILFAPTIIPYSLKYAGKRDLEELFNNNRGYSELLSNLSGKNMLAAFAQASHPLLSGRGLNWKIIISEDISRAFISINAFLGRYISIVFILLALLTLLGLKIGKIIARPVEELADAARRIERGDFNYRLNIATGDEIEELADLFNEMSANIELQHKKILAQKNFIENIVNSLTYAFYVINLDYSIAFVNNAARKAGLSEGGRCYEMTHHVEEPCSGLHLCPLKEVLHTKKAIAVEHEHYDASGKKTVVLVNGAPILNEKGEVIQMIESSIDITERKLAEEKLRVALEEWDRTFNAITDWVFIQDADFTITKANKAFLEAMNARPDEVIGRKCYEITHKLHHHWVNCPFEETRKDKKFHIQEVDDPNIGVPLLISTSPIFDDGGNFLGSVHIATDISKQKEAEEKIREALRIKSEFISTVSHELRTPLTSIKEGISIVFDEAAGTINAEQRDFLDMAKRNVDRLARLINDVLDFQKIDSGKMRFDMRENDLNESIKEAKETMEPLVKEKGLDFVLDLDDAMPRIRFDKDRIAQVLANIISNAIKFTEQGRITLTSKKEENFVHVRIIDTGPGISEKYMPRLFARFEQLHYGKDRKTGGTGLGLAISKEIIERHRGKIWAESEMGKGTAFNFILPIIERRL